MQGLRGNAWRGLVVLAVLIGLVGVWALIMGIAEDQSVPLGLTGRNLGELAAESPDGYRFADFGVRAGGMGLVVIGGVLASVAAYAFRPRQKWAWWAMWALPFWSAALVIFTSVLVFEPSHLEPVGLVIGLAISAVLARDYLRRLARRISGRLKGS